MSAYFVKNGTAEGKESLAELWKTQLDDRGYIIRRGVPQHFLMEVGAEYINEHSKSSASSPFAGGVGAEIRSEAAKTAGETKYFQHGMRELMKRIGG
jgi:hypothetical protein